MCVGLGGYIGIMENAIETTYRGYIGFRVDLGQV